MGLEDDAHAAATDFFQQFVVSQFPIRRCLRSIGLLSGLRIPTE